MRRVLRKLARVPQRQMFAYHKYILNPFRKTPHFIIVGSQKAGTTSLYLYLANHSEIQPSATKEAHFFNMSYDRGIAYYHSIFPLQLDKRFTFDATPDYIDHPLVPSLCSKHYPNIKLVLLLRDPVDRAFSHFNFVQGYNQEESQITFANGLESEEQRISTAFELMNSD